jgi:DNA-binding HxlR family transcriptional regulator
MARRRYGQFCPIARALDLLGDRWTLLIVRELLVGPQRFSDLLEHLPGMWANLLGPRLRALEDAGLVGRCELPPPAARVVYELTERGRALDATFYELSRWGLDLLDEPGTDVVPLHLMALGIKSLTRFEALPDRALRVAFVLDEGAWTLWVDAVGGGSRPIERVRVEDGVAADAEVTVRGSIATLLAVRQGRGAEAGSLTLEGDTDAVAATEALLAPAPIGV